MKFLACINMTLDEEQVRAFAQDLGHEICESTEIKLKGGLNSAFLIHRMLKNFSTPIVLKKLHAAALDGAR